MAAKRTKGPHRGKGPQTAPAEKKTGTVVGAKGKQGKLMDVGPKQSKAMEKLNKLWRSQIEERLAMQSEEAKTKAKLKALFIAEHLTKLEDGSTQCQVGDWMLKLQPTDEKFTATRVE